MTIIKPSIRVLFLATATLAATALGIGTARANFETVISTGHVDLNGFFDGTTLQMNLRLSDTEQFNPATTLIQLGEPVTRPTSGFGSGPEFNFLGVAPGEEIFVSPTNIDTSPFGGPDVPELGLRNSYRPDVGGVNPMFFDFDPTTFSGPGQFSLFTDLGTLFMSSDTSLGAQNFVNVATHSHFNWGFSAPGMYSFDLRARGTNQAGTEIVGPWTTFHVHAVPEPTSFVLMGLGAGVFGLALRRRRLRQTRAEAVESA